MDFVPDSNNTTMTVPFYEDVTSTAGWAGHATNKSEDMLMAEIAAAIGRLGGIVSQWISGSFGNRFGYRLLFSLQGGKPGRIDVVALPLKTSSISSGYEQKKRQAIRMALFNLRDQLESLWRMQQLIPGYFGLLPLMLASENKTIGQIWVEALDARFLLPASGMQQMDEEVVEGTWEKENES